MIVKHSSIHRLQQGFINYYIDPIRLIWFTTLNLIQFSKYMHDVVYLKWCLEIRNKRVWFLSVVDKLLDIGEMTVHFLESVLILPI